MKHFVLVFILVLFSGFHAKAQQSKVREIVNEAFKKHTGGKVLNQYELSVVYDKPGIAPSALVQPNPFLQLIDSMMIAMPDSQRKEVEMQMVEAKKKMFEDLNELYADTKEIYYLDVTAKLNARIFVRPSPAKGRLDTTRQIYSLEKENSLFNDLEVNPVSLLRIMATDTSELHYTGIITFENIDYQVVQVKIGKKWCDVYFDLENGLVNKLITPQVDTDPLIGQGPVYYKNIFFYHAFRNKEGFLLPEEVEVIDTRQEFSYRKKLSWVNINKPFAPSVFAPEPSYTDRAKYDISQISEHLFILEQSGNYENRRSLLWINPKGEIDMFADLPNLEEFNKSEYQIVNSKLKVHTLKNIYNIKNHSWLTGLTDYFSQQIRITAPKGVGIMSHENSSYNPKEDSIRASARTKGLFTTFDKEFKNEFLTAIILNPVREHLEENILVSYYLPREKVIYYNGNPYGASNCTKNALPGEKLLYDIIKNKSLSVEKIIYSGSYLDNAPLFMSYEEFEKRVKNTDFSKYDRKNK